MADEEIFGLSPTEYQDFRFMLEEWRRRPKGPDVPGPSLQGGGDGWRPPIVAVLTDKLESGGQVWASVLARRSYNAIQIVSAYGATAGGYFKLGFKASANATVEWTELIYPLTDDAEKIQGYLSALPSVGVGNVEVTLGLVRTDDGVEHHPWRWSIAWCGKFAEQEVPMVQVDDTALTGAGLIVRADSTLEPTGQYEIINEVIGVPAPTPLKPGARILAQWHTGIGYVPYACEIRDFNEYNLFN